MLKLGRRFIYGESSTHDAEGALVAHHVPRAVLERRAAEQDRQAAAAGQRARALASGGEALGGRVVGVVPHRRRGRLAVRAPVSSLDAALRARRRPAGGYR